MMAQSREWPTAVVLSLYTGRLLCAFSEMHAFAEYLMGDSVWTHQFASRPFVEEMAAALRRQIPALAGVDATGVTNENWAAFRDGEIARLGPTLAVHLMGEPEHYATAFTKPLKGKSIVVPSWF